MSEPRGLEAAEAPDDPAAPVFFLSYWRPKPTTSPTGAPREANRAIMRFFDDLTEDVNNLIGSVPGRDPGFLDVAGDGGELWRRRILRAAGTCHVFVCLVSDPYLTASKWCAREWDLFARRRVVPRQPGAEAAESAIVPVLWTPITWPLPPVVAEVNLFMPTRLRDDFRAGYQAEGMLGLLRTGQENVYQAIVWRLAQHVVRIHRSYRVEPLYVSDSGELRTSFDGSGP
jgi:hypothetical protein